MEPFKTVTGVAFPMIEDDINTDQIAPVQMARGLKPNYAELLFKRQRFTPEGAVISEHPLNQTRYQSPSIFVGGRNFGCGSSREAAVWCLMAIGIRVIVARSIADIYRENCLQNGVLPIELDDANADDFERRVVAADGTAAFTVSLETQTISGGGEELRFDIPAADRMRLIEGLDDIGVSLKHEAEIKAFEQRAAKQFPWQQSAIDRRRGEG